MLAVLGGGHCLYNASMTFRSGRLRIDKERIKTFGAEFEAVQVVITNLVVPRRPPHDGQESLDADGA